MANVADYAWVNQMFAVCITVIRGGRQEPVLELMRADPASEHLAKFAYVEAELVDERYVVQIWQSGEYLVVVEPNGIDGSLPKTPLRMVGDRDALSVYWNINAQMRVMVVEHGEIVRDFDPLLYDDGDEPLPEEEGLGFGEVDEDVRAAALVVLERRTGVVLTEKAVLQTEHPTFVTMPPWRRK